MFIGHDAVAFVAKPAAPRVSLGTTFLAVNWLDLVWPIFLLIGIERVEIDPTLPRLAPLDFAHYPWTHSLLFAALWGVGFGAVHFAFRRSVAAAVLLGLLVLSHWLLDFVVHVPDLPLYPGGPRVGLELWRSVPGAVGLELLLFALGAWVYWSRTEARDAIGRWALVGLIVFLLAIYAINGLSPPPPSARAIAYVGLAGWILPLWAWWVDRHRRMKP